RFSRDWSSDVCSSDLALCGPGTRVVDSAEATASELEALLEERSLGRAPEQTGELSMFVTDIPGRFSEVASRFLGRPVEGLRVERSEERRVGKEWRGGG